MRNPDEMTIGKTHPTLSYHPSYGDVDQSEFKENIAMNYLHPILDGNLSNGVTLLLTTFESEIEEILDLRNDQFEILEEIFIPKRMWPRDGTLFRRFIKLVIENKPNSIVEGTNHSLFSRS